MYNRDEYLLHRTREPRRPDPGLRRWRRARRRQVWPRVAIVIAALIAVGIAMVPLTRWLAGIVINHEVQP